MKARLSRTSGPPFQNPAVESKFESYPPPAREALSTLREWVFATAAEAPEVEGLEETLKWGEPAYITTNRAGTTVRMDWKSKAPDQVALYFHCQTGLVDGFRQVYGDLLEFEGNRAVVFPLGQPLPEGPVRECIAAALTYHVRPKR